jgi:hypothetical protein
MLTRASRKCAVRTLNAARQYATQPTNAAANSSRRALQSASNKSTSETSKRPKSTIATATKERPQPSPAFNRDDNVNVEQISPSEPVELDHSFVGMTGGEIVHEMMLRKGVECICKSFLQAFSKIDMQQLDILVEPFCPFLTQYISLLTLNSFYLDTNKELDTWQRVMPEHQESQVSFS